MWAFMWCLIRLGEEERLTHSFWLSPAWLLGWKSLTMIPSCRMFSMNFSRCSSRLSNLSAMSPHASPDGESGKTATFGWKYWSSDRYLLSPTDNTTAATTHCFTAKGKPIGERRSSVTVATSNDKLSLTDKVSWCAGKKILCRDCEMSMPECLSICVIQVFYLICRFGLQRSITTDFVPNSKSARICKNMQDSRIATGTQIAICTAKLQGLLLKQINKFII